MTQAAQAHYDAFKQRGLKLDMSRGKPAPEQLDLSNALLTDALPGYAAADGSDCRNYGGGVGLPEARALFGNCSMCRPRRSSSTAAPACR
jgi:hypothetical protein